MDCDRCCDEAVCECVRLERKVRRFFKCFRSTLDEENMSLWNRQEGFAMLDRKVWKRRLEGFGEDEGNDG